MLEAGDQNAPMQKLRTAFRGDGPRRGSAMPGSGPDGSPRMSFTPGVSGSGASGMNAMRGENLAGGV